MAGFSELSFNTAGELSSRGMPFSALGLSEPIIRAVTAQNYLAPTPVQREAIPAVLRGADVWAQAQTGSGKTAAFALPVLQMLMDSPPHARREIGILVVVPTRELATQIAESFNIYSEFYPFGLKIVTAIGGVSINPQMMDLRGGADIVIATPGRLLDLVDHNALRLNTVSVVIFDEADKLFDLGFSEELGRLIPLLPKDRQTLLFSATFPPEVSALAESVLRDPVRIEIAASAATTPIIVERAIEVDTPRRTQLLVHLIAENSWEQVLVFVATKYSTGHVAEKLRRAGLTAGSLHGELSQSARVQAMSDFKAKTTQVLVTTDLAARGIDFTQLPAVVNYDLPRSVVSYTHRIGRTGRAGESGTAVTFVTLESFAHFQLIEKRSERVIPREIVEGFEPHALPSLEPKPPGGIKGKRKSKKDKLREAAARAAGLNTNQPSQ